VNAGFIHRSLFPPLASSLLAALILSGCYPDTPPATPDAVSKFLIDLLKDPNPEMRRTAAEGLGKIGASQADGVGRALADPDPRVREAAVIALGRLPVQTDGAQRLLQALGDPAVSVRRAAARSLGELDEVGSTGEGHLEPLLKDPDTTKRRTAIQALMQIEVPEAFPHVAAAVRDPDAEVRQGAVAALGEWWGARAIPLLRDRLAHDAVAGVRAEAAYRLGKIGNQQLVKELIRVAEADPDAVVRLWARWASGELRHQPGSG
jgi:HEAT repeat protein